MEESTKSEQEPVKAMSGAELSYLDQALWTRFYEAQSTKNFAPAWLTLQCSMLPGTVAGIVVLGEQDSGPYVPVATWPEHESSKSTPSHSLAAVCESALAARKGVVSKTADATCAAFPIEIQDKLHGVVAVDVSDADEAALRRVMRKLQWGCGWLEVHILRQAGSMSSGLTGQDAKLAVEMSAVILEAERFKEAATALVTELSGRLGCNRVSLGIREGKHTKVEAVSHSAEFGKHSNLTRAIGLAMDEAIDQQGSVFYPQDSDQGVAVDRAHGELAEIGGGAHIVTVPLEDKGIRYGAITLDFSDAQGFSGVSLSSLQRVVAFVAPVLANLHREDRWIGHKVIRSARLQLTKLFGPNYVGRKLGALLLAAFIIFMATATGVYRVPADATLEGAVERVAVAPIAGYIAEANVRAGDKVAEGDLLFQIDDRDLRLEYLKWSSQEEQINRKVRDALAQHERSEVNVLRAQLDQAKAQLAIIGEQIERTRVVAPFDGIVVSGDLSDQLGAPVERGQILFEVAPLDAYRVALQVEEYSINQIHVGQSGQLVLASMSNQKLLITVDNITPVSTTKEGKNTFRVDASLLETPEFLRPGMQGVARIEVDERRLVWIWTHDLVDWIRLWVWSWWP